MNVDSLQQFVRIVLFAIGGYFLGDGAMSTDVAQAAVGGVVSVATFVWWLVWDKGKDHIPKP
jgi:hypothetical protein